MWKAYSYRQCPSITGTFRKPNEPAACIDETKIRIDKQREEERKTEREIEIDNQLKRKRNRRRLLKKDCQKKRAVEKKNKDKARKWDG